MRTITRLAAGLSLAVAMAAMAGPALASACRITDYTDKPLSALNGVQRLSFLTEITPTEFARLKALPPGDPNYSDVVAKSATAADARNAASDTLLSLKIDNVSGYRTIWATDYLSDEQLRRFADCVSGRYPGLTVMGRSVDPSTFNLTYVHITPIGIEKITTRVLASGNIANVAAFERSLEQLGPQDNYTARTFALKLIDPARPGVLVIRAGWETPRTVYIPVYPTAAYVR